MAIDLKSLVRSGVQKNPPISILHGPPKWGKTTFAATLPSPVFLPFETGSEQLDVDRLVQPGKMKIVKWEEYEEIIAALLSGEHDWKTVVIDSLSSLQNVIWDKVARAHNKLTIDAVGYAAGYKEATQKYWPEFLRSMEALRDNKIMVFMIAHSNVQRFKNPSGTDYNYYDIQVRDDAKELIIKEADNIFFGSYNIVETESKEVFGSKEAKVTGSGERVLFTQDRPFHVAGNRYSIPYEIEVGPLGTDKGWKTIMKHIQAHMSGGGEK